MLVALGLLWAYPVLMVLMNSIKPLGQILQNVMELPKSFYLDNISFVVRRMSYFSALRNTSIVTIATICITLVLASMCGYMLARRKSRISLLILLLFISSLIMPFQTIMIPLAAIAGKLGLIDSVAGTVLVSVGLFSPFAIFMFQGFVKTIPISLEESAEIEGCSQTRRFFAVVFPNLVPVHSTVMVLYFMWLWNDYAMPSIMLTGDSKRTLVPLLYTFFDSFNSRWDYALAAIALAILPVILFFFAMQRYIIRGLTEGAIK